MLQLSLPGKYQELENVTEHHVVSAGAGEDFRGGHGTLAPQRGD